MLGLIVSGDVGGITIYTNRHGRKVAYPKAPPTKPPSPLQTSQRNRFRDSMASWRELTNDQRTQWEDLSLAASLPMTGVNTWIHFALSGDDRALETLESQTRLTVTHPEYIPLST